MHASKSRKETLLNGSGLIRCPRYGSAAAALLGGELGEQIRREESQEAKERGEVDVESLLKGAEKLCGV